jgi:cytochrome c peroxidase
MRVSYFAFGCVVFSIASFGAEPKSEAEKLRARIGPFVKPISKYVGDKPQSKAIVALGRRLFFDTRLSKKQNLSCNACHDLAKYGTNGPAVRDVRQAKTVPKNMTPVRDVPSVYHAAGHKLLYWDSRAPGIERQAEAALLNPQEMGMADAASVVKRLTQIDGYGPLFQEAFPSEGKLITLKRVGVAIGAFERGLVTPAPFDRFMKGDDAALTAQQIAGAILFQDLDCATCHTGSYIGGQMVQKIGVVRPWPNQVDTGYYLVSGRKDHKMYFRVPPLRNVAKTAPYFHDGSSRTLKSAIRRMAWYERGRMISDTQTFAIEAFLGSLTGEIPKAYIQKPKLP